MLDEMEELELEEKAKFFQSIPGILQKKWFTRETYFRHTLNVKQLDNDQYEMLRNSAMSTKRLSGAASYSIHT